MAEQLQSLLERIQKDGVDKAEAQARQIVANAEAKAAELVRQAEARAQAITSQAGQEGEALVERGRIALQQAARDVLISLGDAITRTMRALVRADVQQALNPQTLGRMLEQVVTAYLAAGAGEQRLTALLPPEQQQAVRDYVTGRLSQALRDGIQIEGDGRVVAGFRVAVTGQQVQHDFTEAAITDALCELLRPQISQIVRDATRQP